MTGILTAFDAKTVRGNTMRRALLTTSCMITSAVLMASVAATEARAATPANYIPCSTSTTAPPTSGGDVFQTLLGANGQGGEGSSFEGPGHGGTPGGPGLDFAFTSFPGLTSVSLFSLGGNGGAGSDAGSGDPAGSNGGGVGSAGGNGGTVNLTLSAPVSQTVEGSLFGAICVYSAGGTGGAAGFGQKDSQWHDGGMGGAGGVITVTNTDSITSAQGFGLTAWASGSNGAIGKENDGYLQSSNGGNAGAGGSGQLVTVTNNGSIISFEAGIFVTNGGGDGGPGGAVSQGAGSDTDGGTGGDGGAGGTILLFNNGSISVQNAGASGILAQSFGGLGGVGGANGTAGKSGSGGQGGAITMTLGAGSSIAIAGQDAPGILAQSFGGQGAVGSSGFVGSAGGTGGDGGGIIMQGGGVITVGTAASVPSNSQGILLQSIGGGGGTGGDTSFIAGFNPHVGGSGGVSTFGGGIDVNIGTNITTYGDKSAALMAQSIGGGGGNGGDAAGTGQYYVNVIGGSGGGGGDGSNVTVSSTGTLTTAGANSRGMLLQSIGGGGGNGGSANSAVSADIFGVAFATGGSGAAGGNGGDIAMFTDGSGASTPTNGGIILTSGLGSSGILGQSIGGGGGTGATTQISEGEFPDQQYPTFAFGISHGGKGGGGGNGANVDLGNGGLILTSGGNSRGMTGQSIGGGGGEGGGGGSDSNLPQPSTGDLFVNLNFFHGGSGGTQGTGGTVSLTNSGLILTTGVDADAMFAHSIGGGGGLSGLLDGGLPQDVTMTVVSGATAGVDPNGTGSIGGTGDGGAVSVNSSQSILTLGDGSSGMVAQSVGGGGGRVGGLAGQWGAGSGTVNVDISLGAEVGGGSNAAGADPIAQAVNSGILFTFGADATGMIVQSVGGGGGIVGKGATNIGFASSTGDGGNAGPNAGSIMQQLASAGTAGLPAVDTVQEMITLSAKMLGTTTNSPDYITQLAQIADAQGTASYDGNATSLTVALALGGSSTKTGQDGGYVTAQNQGYISTGGKMSTGMLVQSVGAGGGIAGVANTVLASDSATTSIQMGGTKGTGGDGGNVTASNSDAIVTNGSLAPGILAQSIGGGGGLVSLSGSGRAMLAPLQVSLGIDSTAGVGGSGGNVTVDNTGWIVTQSHDSIGILAQSIGGGGGLVRLLATDLELDSGQVKAGQSFAYNLALAACTAKDQLLNCGDGGAVTVTNTGSGGGIETQGDGAHGILAQSIGGGGGALLGGQATNGGAFGSVSNGDGGAISVTVGNGNGSGNSNITTSGDGAVAILAQSIGGGGLLAGRLGGTSAFSGFSPTTGNTRGNGNSIDILLNAGTILSTQGKNAPVILAQSIGGGGGLTSSGTTVLAGSVLGNGSIGTGAGGPINIVIAGTVQASGANSAGIMAQSVGGAQEASNTPLNVIIGATGVVRVGQKSIPTAAGGLSAGIYLDGGSIFSNNPNQVVNNGSVLTYGSGLNSVAVYSTGGQTQVINNGTMLGDVLLSNNGGNGCFTNSGTFTSGNAVTVGACGVTNTGTMTVGRTAESATLTITGNYVGTGKLVFDADFSGSISDKLVIAGDARVGDTITVNAKSISNRSLTLLSASGKLTIDPAFSTTDGSHLYDFKASAVGNAVSVTPVANFNSEAAGFGANEKAIAANLQSLFDGGASADLAFSRLLLVADDAGYAAGLQSLAGQGLGAFGAARFNSSRNFAANLYGGCGGLQFEARTGDRCGWARVLVNGTKQQAATDKLGYSADAVARQIGLMQPVSDTLLLSGSFAYETSKFRDARRTARITGNSIIGGVGLLYSKGQLELSAGIDAAYGWYKSSRSITLGSTETATAKPEQSQLGGHFRVAYNLMPGSKSFARPFVEGHAIHVLNKAFTESGTSPFRLAVESRSDTALIGVAGIEVGTLVPLSAKVSLRPFASAALEYGNPRDWTTTARFADQAQGNSFDLKTAGPGTLGRFTVGADLIGSDNVALSIQYAPELGKDFTSHSGTARLTVAF